MARLSLVFLLTTAFGCAHLGKPADPPEPSFREQAVFDVDLTQGEAGPGQVTGGSWDGGWRAASGNAERIVFDAGKPLANGSFEVSFTMSKPPHGTKGKIQWVGLYEDASLSQAKSSGDIFYARAGEAAYKFARVKAYGRKFDKNEWENDVGMAADWVIDDKTVQTVKLQWKGGRAIFVDSKGKEHKCPKKLCGGAHPIDKLRYAVIGSDMYTNISLEGIRFTRVKLVELLP